MHDRADPTEHLAGTLASYGVAVDEVDKAVMSAAWAQFGAGIEALLEADLDEVEHEIGFDPSKPPA